MNIVKALISRNYTVGRSGYSPRFLVMHTYDGGGRSLKGWFNSLNAQASAHFGVFKDGGVEQYVEESNTAWGNGSGQVTIQGITTPNMNLISISIEHQDDNNPGDSVRTPQQYESSAQLVAYLCKKYRIPCNRKYILKHNEIPGVKKSCPGGLDIDRIINRANEILNSIKNPIDLSSEFYTLQGSGIMWRSNAVAELNAAGIAIDLNRFNELNPQTPKDGWRAGMQVRINPPSIPKEDPMEIEKLKTENAALTINLNDLKKENSNLTFNLKKLQEDYDKVDRDYKTYKEDTETRFNLFEDKLNKLEEMNKTVTALNENQKEEISNLNGMVKNLNIKIDDLTKERDALKIENDMWKGKVSGGQLTVSDFPSKFMYYWKKIEAKFGKTFTYNATNALAAALTTIFTLGIGFFTSGKPVEFLTQHLGWAVPAYLLFVQPTVVAFFKDESNKNKIFLNIIHLFDPQYDPYGNRQEAIMKVEEKATQ